MNTVLPDSIARCNPSKPCAQSSRCARHLAAVSDLQHEIDASACIPKSGCDLFLDARGLSLMVPERRAYQPASGTVLARALEHLAKHGPTRNGDLEVAMGVTRHSMPGFVKPGIKYGLLHRATVDGVRVFVLGPKPSDPPPEQDIANPGELPFEHRVVTEWQPINLTPRAARSIFDLAAA